MKTNGARILESLGIPFALQEYEVDPDDLSAITVAKKIGMPPEQVFKTLLTTGGPDLYVFAVIPGDAELDFKKLARAAGLRKAEMVPLKEVQPLTGYIRGGVTVFGAKKPYPVFVDETAILFDKISVSAGARGTQLILAPGDYLRATPKPQTADLTKIRCTGGTPPMTRALWTHLVKDLRIEWRSLDAMISMLFFSGLVVVLFSIAFDPRGAVLAADRRRRALRGHHVRFGQRAQSGLGARDSPPGHGRAAHGSRARRGALPGQGHRQLSLRLHRAGRSWRRSSSSFTTCTSRATRGCWRWCCRWAHGRWSRTASSLPRSP